MCVRVSLWLGLQRVAWLILFPEQCADINNKTFPDTVTALVKGAPDYILKKCTLANSHAASLC